MIGILAAVGSAILHPIMSALAKKAAHPLTLNFWGICLAFFVFFPVFLDSSFWERILEYRWLVATSSGLHFIYIIALLELLKRHDFQVIYPLTRSAPVFTLVGEAWLLHTEFSALQVLGFLLVTGGVFILGFDRALDQVRAKVFIWVLFIVLLTMAYFLADKQLLQIFNPSELWAIVCFQIPFLAYILFREPKAAVADLKNWKNLLFYTAAMIGTWYLALTALSQLPAASVTSLRNLGIIFGVFLGAHLFSEGHRGWRYVAAGLLVIGAFLSTLS
jgi:drug/metabolite transporter (DMT)-like permease